MLICGKTELLDRESLGLAAQYYRVVVCGESEAPRHSVSKRIHIYRRDPASEDFERLLYAYAPDAVWYFSGYADGGDGLANEREMIENLVRRCASCAVGRLIVVSSVNSLRYTLSESTDDFGKKIYDSEQSFDCAQMEALVQFAAERNGVQCVIIRAPYIAKMFNRGNYLGRLFETIADGKPLQLPCRASQRVDFLSNHNLTELLISVTEETMAQGGVYTALSGYRRTCGELGGELQKCAAEASISYEDASCSFVLNEDAEARKLRQDYGFIASDDVVGDLPLLYGAYQSARSKKPGLRQRFAAFFSALSEPVRKLAELIILFALVQLLLRYTADSVYFRYVDLRLFFVVILGTTHGMLIGALAGLLECVSLLFDYAKIGVTGAMLFYNMDYWLPFAIYLMAGSITGYVSAARSQKLHFAEEQARTLREKYRFLNSVYLSVIENKETYKRQILGYKDSFGKIFDAVEKLNSATPASIFMNGIETLEHILDNHTIAIYIMDDYQKYGRLVACSREMSTRLRKSLNIGACREMYEVVRNRETWKNTSFREGLPAYAYAIVEGDAVRLLICIYEASSSQMDLYYMNLFTILCHLIRLAFMRALAYQNAIEREKFYPGTEILLPEYFVIELDSQRKMAEAGVASYLLLDIHTDDFTETGSRLQSMIRHSDIIGNGTDGKHYLLLTQTDREIFRIIGDRLTQSGIDYTIAEGM